MPRAVLPPVRLGRLCVSTPRQFLRVCPRAHTSWSAAPTATVLTSFPSSSAHHTSTRRPFSTTGRRPLPPPPSHYVPAAITESQYHDLADEYLERMVERLEEMQDEREDVDVEFSSGVLTLAFTGADGAGNRTYVINKQPPNKQIWLSSPISGPKRFDWVVEGKESKADKEGDGSWIYLKDGSSLNAIFKDEIGIDLDAPGPDDRSV